MEQTIKCYICGRSYKFYSMLAGDQSACPDCRRRAKGISSEPYRHNPHPKNEKRRAKLVWPVSEACYLPPKHSW